MNVSTIDNTPAPELATEKQFFLPAGDQCAGCGSLIASRLALKAVFSHAKDALIFGTSCGGGRATIRGWAGLGMECGGLTGVEAAFRVRGAPERHLVVFSGEGRLFEMNFDHLSTAFERQQQATYVVFDNQGYSQSGAHRTGTTPLGVRTKVYHEGKDTHEKQVALMMIFNNAAYAATATPAYPRDLQDKVRMALENKPSLVQVLCPCITSWKYDSKLTVAISRLAVETGLFPLWEYSRGVFRRTVQPRKRVPVERYLEAQRRYDGITEEQVQALNARVEHLDHWISGLERAFPPQ